MTLFGIEPEVTLLRWGKEKTREAQSYMQKAVQYVKDLIEAEKLVIATNAWTLNLKTSPKIANVQAPVWTYQIVTAPLTQLDGRLIADLVLGEETGLTKFWIVNRRAIPLPPGNMLRFAGIKLIEGVLNAVDWYEEGGSKKPRN